MKKVWKHLKLKWKNLKKGINHVNKFNNCSFIGIDAQSPEQYEAIITRLYHTVEKGLSFKPFRPGFGQENIKNLIQCMENYQRTYGEDSFFYETALDTLNKYIETNKKYGKDTPEIENAVRKLKGKTNSKGGALHLLSLQDEQIRQMNFEDLVKSRHSVRQFSGEPVDFIKLEKALEIAQSTPSACNRQGWVVHVIQNEELLKSVLKNQNGNRGFGDNIDKLLLVTTDLEYFNQDREVFQAFIDGGLYSMNLLNALYFENIASVPLSASLTPDQESKVRKLLNIKESEVFILFIGIGSYPEQYSTTRSQRKKSAYILH